MVKIAKGSANFDELDRHRQHLGQVWLGFGQIGAIPGEVGAIWAEVGTELTNLREFGRIGSDVWPAAAHI